MVKPFPPDYPHDDHEITNPFSIMKSNHPKVFLFDEPLSNLDKKLRSKNNEEIGSEVKPLDKMIKIGLKVLAADDVLRFKDLGAYLITKEGFDYRDPVIDVIEDPLQIEDKSVAVKKNTSLLCCCWRCFSMSDMCSVYY